MPSQADSLEFINGLARAYIQPFQCFVYRIRRYQHSPGLSASKQSASLCACSTEEFGLYISNRTHCT